MCSAPVAAELYIRIPDGTGAIDRAHECARSRVYWHVVTTSAGDGTVAALIPEPMRVLRDAFAGSIAADSVRRPDPDRIADGSGRVLSRCVLLERAQQSAAALFRIALEKIANHRQG